MNPFTPHLEEAFKLLREHMRSTDPRVSIRACRTIIAADLRYRMLEYTAVRAEYATLKHQHTAPTAPSAPPTAPSDVPDPSGAPRTAQSAPRAPAPPRFDELREELRLAPEHRDLVAACHTSGVRNADPPNHRTHSVEPEPSLADSAPKGRSSSPPHRASPVAALVASAGGSFPMAASTGPTHLPNTT